MIKFQGWVMFPFKGQVRFTLTCNDRGREITLSDRDPRHDAVFNTNPVHSPPCDDLSDAKFVKKWMTQDAAHDLAKRAPRFYMRTDTHDYELDEGARIRLMRME